MPLTHVLSCPVPLHGVPTKESSSAEVKLSSLQICIHKPFDLKNFQIPFAIEMQKSPNYSFFADTGSACTDTYYHKLA